MDPSPADTASIEDQYDGTHDLAELTLPEGTGVLNEVVDQKSDDKETKKKKKKSKASKPTGFEEYYCEPLLTPTEAWDEKSMIYSPERPFVERIEEAIQRYRARRRLDSVRNQVFSQYLMLGGIDATARQFQSADKLPDDLLRESTKGQLRDMISDDVIQRGGGGGGRFYDPGAPEHWDVDFTGVVAGFMSHKIIDISGGDMEMVWIASNTIQNFLKYLLLHDVCPEYADDINSAIELCDKGFEEIGLVSNALRLVPGLFNRSVAANYCEEENSYAMSLLMDHKELDRGHAFNIVALIATIVLPTLGSYNAANIKALEVTNPIERTFEITSITPPTEEMRQKVALVSEHLRKSNPSLAPIQPCGVMAGRPVIVQDGWDITDKLTDEEVKEESSFILEERILEQLRVGMKLTMGVSACNVPGGGAFKVIRYVKDIKPTYYTFLPQELMRAWKEPVPNERPAPSVHDRHELLELAGDDGADD
ncbi:Argonaute complex, subunit Arb1 [Triangularia verruculosa]|uniref:Argonaute complex, subunit Arb1 n=1 Tax=Triangularia verruculosa TaxID=2587418 RepID=A0AAN7AS75_9PEZI|nr:Argonaute complex, subunit Arb1 [Triangularia verruculosa]